MRWVPFRITFRGTLRGYLACGDVDVDFRPRNWPKMGTTFQTNVGVKIHNAAIVGEKGLSIKVGGVPTGLLSDEIGQKTVAGLCAAVVSGSLQ